MVGKFRDFGQQRDPFDGWHFYIGGYSSGKTTMVVGMQELSRQVSLFTVETNIRNVRRNLRAFLKRWRRRSKKMVPHDQKQQWRQAEQRRSRQQRPGRL